MVESARLFHGSCSESVKIRHRKTIGCFARALELINTDLYRYAETSYYIYTLYTLRIVQALKVSYCNCTRCTLHRDSWFKSRVGADILYEARSIMPTNSIKSTPIAIYIYSPTIDLGTTRISPPMLYCPPMFLICQYGLCLVSLKSLKGDGLC